jgi:4-hydroxy-tetrahydrodipicolinate synthase
MTNRELHGVIVPVVTPVNKKEEVDESVFRRILRRLIEAGVHGIFVGGSAGEGPLLGDREWRRMVETAIDEVDGDVPLLAGAMDTSAQRVCNRVKTLKTLGYRYFVLTPSFYYSAKSSSEQLRLFGQAKEAAGKMEMVAYNIPQCTGAALGVETVCEMARRGLIRYCKESSGDWKYLKSLIRKGTEVGLVVLAGDEPLAADALLAGAKGIVPVCANYTPERYIRLYETASRGDRKAARDLMPELMSIRDNLLLSGPCWIAGIKYAMSALGFGSGQCVSPLEPVDEKRTALIDAMVESHCDAALTRRNGARRRTTVRRQEVRVVVKGN